MTRRLHPLASLALLVALSACKEGSTVKVASLKFVGVKAVTEAQLRSVLATTASSRIPLGEKHYFSREQFDADLKRIEAFYRDRGFPEAKVADFNVELNKDQTSVKIVVIVAEGEPAVVETLTVEGIEVVGPERVAALQARLPLKVGAPLDRALLQADRETVLDELREQGYPYGSVSLTETAGSSPRNRVVTLRAVPGQLAHFGDLEIQGNTTVSDRIIRRQLTFRRGDIYRQSKVLESQRRLYGLELFQFASIKPATEDKAPEIPTRITVTEGKHKKVNFSFGYGSEERARGEVDWRNVNFLGGARTAGATARYSSLDRGVRVNFGEPYFFSRDYSLGVSAQIWHADEPAFTLDTRGVQFTATRRFGRAARAGLGASNAAPTTFSIGYANEREEYVVANETLLDLTQRDELIALGVDPSGSGGGRRSAFSMDAGRNTTGNLLDARQGYVASVHLEQAGRWLQGDFDYYEATFEGRYYQSLGNRAVLAVRARGGSVAALGDEEEVVAVPFFKRYFLGGASNLRGWGRFDVSPLVAGLPVGGQTMFNFSTELRVPVFGNLGGVVFVDGGNVWGDPWSFKLGDMRYDVGPGIRYKTPIGPLRVDLGYQLNPIPGLIVNGAPEARRFRFHFSIGQAF